MDQSQTPPPESHQPQTPPPVDPGQPQIPPPVDPGQPQIPPPPGGAPAPSPANARTFAMLCHLSAFAGLFVPFGNVLGPLIVWMVKKDEIPAIDPHGKESVNFQISLTIYMIVSAFLILVIVGIFLMIGLAIFWAVVVIIASMRANEGGFYRYPLTIRFIN